jgi:hypothetical protein
MSGKIEDRSSDASKMCSEISKKGFCRIFRVVRLNQVIHSLKSNKLFNLASVAAIKIIFNNVPITKPGLPGPDK